MKNLNKLAILYVMLLISYNSTISNEWQSIPYPEFKPYTSSLYCRSDAQGNIWLFNDVSSATPFSAAIFDGEKWTEFSQSAGTLPKDSTIEKVITRFNGEVVVITPTAMYVSNSTSSWNKVALPEIGSNTSPLLNIRVEDAIEDKNGNLWILRNLRFNGINISHVSRFNGNEWTSWCTDIPLYSYKGENALQFRTYGNYSSIKQAPNGDIWLFGRNGFFSNPDSASKYVSGGIACWDRKEWKFWMKELGIDGKGLNDNGTNFSIDSKNRLIFAQGQYSGSPFISGGIIMFDDGEFAFYRQDNRTIPSDTALGLPGTNFGNMVYNKNFVALNVAAIGSTWYFNTAYHGILEFDGTRWSSIANKTNGLTNGSVDGGYGIAIDKNGDLWATILGGDVVHLRKKTSSVTKDTQTQGLVLAPNPAGRTLKLIFENIKEAPFSGDITIVNTLGENILQIPATESIDISALPNGIYFLKVNFNNKIYTEKFIVNK